MALSLNTVEQGVDIALLQGIAPTELCVEVRCIFRDGIESVINLVEDGHIFIIGIDVLHGDTDSFAKRYGPVAVEGATGIDTYSQ